MAHEISKSWVRPILGVLSSFSRNSATIHLEFCVIYLELVLNKTNNMTIRIIF